MEYRVFIADTEYGMDSIESVTIEYPLFDKLSIGNACSAQLNMTFWPIAMARIPRMAQITPKARNSSSDELAQLGTFYIDERYDRAGGKKNLVAYDSMLKADQPFEEGLTEEVLPLVEWKTTSSSKRITTEVIDLIAGELYDVWFDDTRYLCECYAVSGSLPNGTAYATLRLGSEDTGEPFVVTVSPGGALIPGVTVKAEPGIHTLKITGGTEFPMPMKNAVEYIAAKMGVSVDPRSVDMIADGQVDYPTDDYTMRDVLCFIAAASAGNWIITADNKLYLVPLFDSNGANHDLGRTVTSFEYDDDMVTVTGVSLIVDDETEYFAGDRSGYVLEAKCPYATAEIAASVLNRVNFRQYRGFRATGAKLPITAERGDKITIAGMLPSFLLANQTLRFGPGHVSDIAAPMYEEVDHEYQYVSSNQREINRQIAKNRSLISKTAREIRMEVFATDGRVSSLSLTVDGLSTRVETAEGNVSSLSQTVSGFEARVSNAETGLSQTLRLGADGVTITNAEGSSLKIDGGQINADNLQVKAANVSGTLTAQKINLMGDLEVYDYYAQLGGHLGYTPSSLDGSAAIHMAKGSAEVTVSDYAAKINYNGYAQVYVGPNTSTGWGVVVIASGSDEVRFQHDYTGRRSFYPNHSEIHLGLASLPWGAIYSKDGTIQQSDFNLKNSVEDLPQKYIDLILWLSAKRFKLNEGSSGRYHVGFIAQDVEAGMEKFGIDSLEFAGFIKDKDKNGNDIYMLRYNEFIAMLVAAVQVQQKVIVDHENRLKKLEAT